MTKGMARIHGSKREAFLQTRKLFDTRTLARTCSCAVRNGCGEHGSGLHLRRPF